MRVVRWMKLDVSRTCRSTRRLLPLWAGGDLHGEAQARLEGHLAVCPTCHRESLALKRVMNVLELAASAPRYEAETTPIPWSMPGRGARSAALVATPSVTTGSRSSSSSSSSGMPGIGTQLGLVGALAAVVLIAVAVGGNSDRSTRTSWPTIRSTASLNGPTTDRVAPESGNEVSPLDAARGLVRSELPPTAAAGTLEASLIPSPGPRGEEAVSEVKNTY